MTDAKTASERSTSEEGQANRSPSAGVALVRGNREVITDHYFSRHVTAEPNKYKFKVFTRLNAKRETRFEKVNFQHCVFDGCYMPDCVFDSCDFTGCRFVGCNFHHTTFAGCKFDYATFERTQIDENILTSEAPREENLKMRFARSLRMNFSQIGDARAVNRAISIELEATAVHLFKSWRSSETYYARKYVGFRRFVQFGKWVEFRVLDGIWGNGESIVKLMRTILFVLIAIGLYGAINSGEADRLGTYWEAVVDAPGVFLGVTDKGYPTLITAVITAARLVSIALLTALLVKRFGRR